MMFEVGDRVMVIAGSGEERACEYGTVTRCQYPATLTGRPMVDVLFDGDREGIDDEGVYVQNLERVLVRAA